MFEFFGREVRHFIVDERIEVGQCLLVNFLFLFTGPCYPGIN